MKVLKLAPALIALAFASSACGGDAENEPLDGRQVALAADANFRRVAVEFAESSRFLLESQALRGSLCGDLFAAPGETEGDWEAEEEPPVEEAAPCLDAAFAAEQLAVFLAERIFTRANIESEDGSTVVFLLRPEVVCAGSADCSAFLSDTPVRLRVRSDQPGDLEIALLVGMPSSHPLDIHLNQGEIEIQVEIAEVRRLLVQLGAPQEELPSTMEGRLGLALSRHAAGDFTASLSVLEPIAIRSHGAAAWELDLGRALPAAALRIDAMEEALSLRLGIAGASLRVPLGLLGGLCDGEGCEESSAPGGTLGLRLAGLSGRASLGGGSDGLEKLLLEAVDFGGETTVVDIDGRTILTLDVNARTGRAFDLEASADERGMLLRFDPGLELDLGVFLGGVADRFVADGLQVPDWTLEEALRIRLDGAAAPRIRLLDLPQGAIEVLEGALTLESDSLAPVIVGEGLCLLQTEPAEELPAHPFAGLEAGSCQP